MGQLLGKKAYDKAAIECNGREVVTNFEPSTYEGEVNLVNNNQGTLRNWLVMDLSHRKEKKSFKRNPRSSTPLIWMLGMMLDMGALAFDNLGLQLRSVSSIQRQLYAQMLQLKLLYLFVFSQFGDAIVCSDAASEANRYEFTAVDRPEGFLLLVWISYVGLSHKVLY